MANEMTREYLSDEMFHRTYLRDHPERETSPWVVGMAVAGAAAGGLLAYKKGMLKPVAEAIIRQVGSYRNGQLHAINQGLRNWTEREFRSTDSWRYKYEMLKMDIDSSRKALQRRQLEMAQSGSPFDTQNPGEMMNLLTQRDNLMKNLDTRWSRMTQQEQQKIINKYKSQMEWKRAVERKMNAKVRDENKVTAQQQMEHVKRTGYRFMTIGEAMPHLSEEQRGVFTLAGNSFGKDFYNRIYDKNILINDKTGHIADVRDFRDMVSGIMDSVADDFTTPFVKINPIRMLYLNKFNSVNKPPEFTILSKNTRQPAITKNMDSLGEDHVFISGNVFNLLDPEKLVAENVRLVEGKMGPVARYYRNLTGLTTAKFHKPNDFWGKVRYNVGQAADIGFQDEPIGRDISLNYTRGQSQWELPNVWDPTTWPSYFAKKVHNKFRPYEYSTRIKLEDAFGADAEWLVFNNYRTVEQAGSYKNYMKQFTAGRNNLEDVTTATLFPYGFFERLNATLNQIGLGLSNDKLGSAFDVFKGLMLYRILPVYGAVQTWDYLNYESENLFGVQFEDKFAEFYAGASVDLAGIRDALGITDWAKNFAYLLPGGDQIAEIPFVGNFVDLNQTAEETMEYWESGEDPVRKGRFWEFGTTPYTGGKIEYWQPNWVRRVLSDYDFQETMHGSREEYFANAPFPTLRHPLAPIRHFITDQDHYAEKHYYDRPYLTTGGGFSILEDFPLVGPLLNATVGQVLNPSRKMHEEYWMNWTGPGSMEPRGAGLQALNIDMNWMGPTYDSVEDDYAVDPIQNMVDTALHHVQTSEIVYDETGPIMDPGIPVEAVSGIDTSVDATGLPAGVDVSQVGGGAPMSLSLVRGEPATYAAYTTPSGAFQVTQVAESMVARINQKIKEKSLAKADREAQMVYLPEGSSFQYGTTQISTPNTIQNTLGNFYYNMTEMGGAYGFYAETLTGDFHSTPTMAKASEMTTMSRHFWDMNIGNLGGDANEIFRRFLPRNVDLGKNYNPVPNTMPSWMPGEEYFMDFQHGDPYTKIKQGEMRLPGHSYESLYGIDSAEIDEAMRLDVGASLIGRPVQEIVDSMLRRDEIQDEEDKFVTDAGTNWHKDWEAKMQREGIAVEIEQYVKDPNLGIGGFFDMKADHVKWLEYALNNAESFTYYQDAAYETANRMVLTGHEKYGGFYDEGTDILALRDNNADAFAQFVADSLNGAPMAIVDPKTMSSRKYDADEMYFYNVQQVNFYLHATGQKRGYLMHVNRDELNGGNERFQIHAFDFNPELLQYSVSKVEAARGHIREGLQDGTYGRGDFYDLIDQYRILSDVAPYSQQYRDLRKTIRQWEGLTEEGLEEVREIEEQGRARRENVRMTPYRFTTSNIDKQKVTVRQVLDNNTFLVEELDNPIKLAGVRVPSAQNDPAAEMARRMINLRPGDRVTIGIDADELNQVNDDTYQTIDAVVYNRGININRELIDAGLAKEKVEDFSPAAVHARFTNGEIAFGKLWERFAHWDSPYHTKFLQVRSPLEQYERREVYGKSWQEWSSPVEDFFIPWFQNIVRKEPVIAMATGALMGSLFGNTRYGKIVGALVGLTVSTAGVGYLNMYEEITGDKWVPQRRKDEWELHEYLDILKYIKYRRLYEWSADEALEKEGFDVRAYVADRKAYGDRNSGEKNYLEDLKVRLKRADDREYEAIYNEIMDLDYMEPYINEAYDSELGEVDLYKAINARLKDIMNSRELDELTPMAARALTYYQESEQTMYGYDPGEPLANFMAALPRKDREYLLPMMEAPEEERDDILNVVPDYMKRVLQASWGMEAEPKEDLLTYFQEHDLPHRGWIGWDDRASLNDVKVKMVRKEKLDDSDFNIWDDDRQRAAYSTVQAPDLNGGHNISEIQSRLSDILRGIGLEEVYVTATAGGASSTVNMNVQVDRRMEIMRRMNEERENLI